MGTKIQYRLCSPFSLKIWPLFPCILEIKPPLSPVPQNFWEIFVSIILIGTVTIQACMIHFVQIIIDTYISADFSSEHIIGVR